MLLDRDRQVGHELAGAWLERAGEPDPVVLAEHFERGAVRGKAALWHARAAERALRSLDLAPALSWDYAMLGAFEEAERCVERALSLSRSARANVPLAWLVMANVRLGERRLDEAVAAATAALGEALSQSEGVIIMAAQLALVEARLLRGEVDAAVEVLGGSSAGTSGLLAVDAMARGLQAKILLARGRAEEAAREAEQVIALVRGAGVYDVGHAALLLTRAEALDAAGEAEAARAAIREAREDLLTRAARIEDPAYRRSFLERVPEHARTLLVARAWLGEGTCPGIAGP